MNWRGRPLTSHEVVVQTIATTTTRTGLRVRAELDDSTYETGVKVSDRQMDALPLTRHDWHGDWNYTLRPEPYDQDAGAPDPFDQPSPDLAWLCHPALTDEQAKAEFWPRWREVISLVAAERGFSVPTEESFDRETGPAGALCVGSPKTVARKIATNLRALGANRFDLKYGVPGMTHEQLITSIELYGREVIPRVRELAASP
jgi:hypothetical protein